MQSVYNFIDETVKNIQSFKSGHNAEVAQQIAKLYSKNERILFTGIGKCSYLAMKQAATFKSIRKNAEFLDAVNAMHGDLGTIKDDEKTLVLALSKSGKTGEIFALFNALQNKENVTLCILCMGDAEDVHEKLQEHGVRSAVRVQTLRFDEVSEFDGYGIVPSQSNALFEFALSLSVKTWLLSNDKQTLNDLKAAHPGGSLQNKVTRLLAKIEDDLL